ncbi:hypothetical protein CYCD_20820 [Tenuifilaceae bacterium CYCD]|nr:hypothetical protein CYCD_20820 [Tenuifilaceae bacterium CYCD]
MNKKFIVTLFLLTNALIGFCQLSITGTVISKDDNIGIPGVLVVVKGNEGVGTSTDMDGKFMLDVPDSDVILIVSFVGMKSKEVKLNGQRYLTIVMKSDCHMDSFDHQLIGFSVSSGVIHSPIGGEVDFSFPAFFRSTTLKAGMSYQTNLHKNEFINAQVEFDHVIFQCDIRMDLKWYYHKFSDNNSLHSTSYSFESHVMFLDINDWNINDIGLIVGYGENSYESINKGIRIVSTGPTIGVRAYLANPLHATVAAKISVYNGVALYQGEVNRLFRKFSAFARYYQLDSFVELSLGVGIDINYRFKKQKV